MLLMNLEATVLMIVIIFLEVDVPFFYCRQVCCPSDSKKINLFKHFLFFVFVVLLRFMLKGKGMRKKM